MGRRGVAVIGAVVAVVVLVVAGVAVWFLRGDRTDGGRARAGPIQLTLLPTSEGAALTELTANRVNARRGAVVAVDPLTGALLVAVSTPEPGGSAAPGPAGILDERRRQLANGAIATVAAPGAPFQVVVAAMALANGDTTETSVPAGDRYVPPGQSFSIRNPAPGCAARVTLQQALAQSCNTAFAQICVARGADLLAGTAAAFGFGKPGGTVFTDDAKDLFRTPTSTTGPLDGTEPVALAQTCLGQRDVRMSPLLGSLVAAAAVNGGRLLRPYLVRQKGGYVATTQELGRPLTEPAADQLRAMMVAAAGTGGTRAAQIPGVEVGGKAATGQDPGEDGWFIGFAKNAAGRPVVAVAVFLEGAGQGGGAAAARVGGQVMRSVIAQRP